MASFGGGGPSEDEITYNKRMFACPSSVVATQSLLILGRPYDGGVLLHLEHVDVRLALLLSLLLVVEMNEGRVEVKVKGDDCLSPIDEEESGVTS